MSHMSVWSPAHSFLSPQEHFPTRIILTVYNESIQDAEEWGSDSFLSVRDGAEGKLFHCVGAEEYH